MADPLLMPCPPALLRPGRRVVVRYRNHRGESAVRDVIPARHWHGVTEWHPEPQPLLDVWDVAKHAERTFATRDIVLVNHEGINLADPSVRDALARCLWAALRPGEPEPLTAPRFRFHAAMGCWLLGDDDGDTRAITFGLVGCSDLDHVVPTLTDDMWQRRRLGDRAVDLVALWLCAMAVLFPEKTS